MTCPLSSRNYAERRRCCDDSEIRPLRRLLVFLHGYGCGGIASDVHATLRKYVGAVMSSWYEQHKHLPDRVTDARTFLDVVAIKRLPFYLPEDWANIGRQIFCVGSLRHGGVYDMMKDRSLCDGE